MIMKAQSRHSQLHQFYFFRLCFHANERETPGGDLPKVAKLQVSRDQILEARMRWLSGASRQIDKICQRRKCLLADKIQGRET
jgi:hypothetical protein